MVYNVYTNLKIYYARVLYCRGSSCQAARKARFCVAAVCFCMAAVCFCMVAVCFCMAAVCFCVASVCFCMAAVCFCMAAVCFCMSEAPGFTFLVQPIEIKQKLKSAQS